MWTSCTVFGVPGPSWAHVRSTRWNNVLQSCLAINNWSEVIESLSLGHLSCCTTSCGKKSFFDFLPPLKSPCSRPRVRRRSWKLSGRICHLSALRRTRLISPSSVYGRCQARAVVAVSAYTTVNSLTCGSATKVVGVNKEPNKRGRIAIKFYVCIVRCLEQLARLYFSESWYQKCVLGFVFGFGKHCSAVRDQRGSSVLWVVLDDTHMQPHRTDVGGGGGGMKWLQFFHREVMTFKWEGGCGSTGRRSPDTGSQDQLTFIWSLIHLVNRRDHVVIVPCFHRVWWPHRQPDAALQTGLSSKTENRITSSGSSEDSVWKEIVS